MHSKLSSALCFNMDQSKILSPGNGLKDPQTINGKTENNVGKGENEGIFSISKNVSRL